ncbi:hypothetical protein T4A_1755 [Trichinella pseudospiralis]|uniref:Uncharacterized protein n=1 Tax=Trichinella pseudospiralis TaxID=6337 RepID=A0A0V1EHK8_TRIPS|nr:hypothetical protein T4A_1755 [Trichinella pseudospiralis]
MYYNSSTEDKGNAKSASFRITGIAFASSVFKREHYRQERHPLRITDFVLGLNTNLCFITSTTTTIPVDAEPKTDIYNSSAFSINSIPSTENGIL